MERGEFAVLKETRGHLTGVGRMGIFQVPPAAGRRGRQAVHVGVRPRAANLGDVPPCGWRSCLSSYLAAFSSVARDARATFASCTAFGS